jgi:RHS repeat-associated protein
VVTPNLRAVSLSHRIRYVHDRHRLTQVKYPDGRTVDLYYGGPGAWGNGAGRLQTRVDDSGYTYLAYGALGETNWTWRYLRPAGSVTSWTSVSTYWSYDSFGRQRSVTYNDNETVDYHYDRGGNLQSVTGTPYGGTARNYVSFVGYDAYGQRSRVTLGNGTETRYHRDPLMQRLKEVNTDGPGATALQRLRYSYNAAGNITERNQKPGLLGGAFGGDVFQSFEYDQIGQLTSATGFYQESSTHERRYTLAMQYDAIGNITNKTQDDVRSLLGGGSPSTLAGTSHALGYTYPATGSPRPHAATQVGTRTFTYDPNGNQLGWTDSATSSTRSMAWDEDDRLESVTTDGSTVNFLYDGAGERTHKYSSAGVSIYANAYWSVRNGVQTTKHIFVSGQRIASIVNDPATGTQEHWLHTDHLGSTQFVTDATGAVREHHESFPFGEPWIEESSASDTTPFRFTGKELDSETGLQYFGARYYDPRQGQWASVDPALAEYVTERSMRPDRYWDRAYANNSPLTVHDPDGRTSRPLQLTSGATVHIDDQPTQARTWGNLGEQLAPGANSIVISSLPASVGVFQIMHTEVTDRSGRHYSFRDSAANGLNVDVGAGWAVDTRPGGNLAYFNVLPQSVMVGSSRVQSGPMSGQNVQNFLVLPTNLSYDRVSFVISSPAGRNLPHSPPTLTAVVRFQTYIFASNSDPDVIQMGGALPVVGRVDWHIEFQMQRTRSGSYVPVSNSGVQIDATYGAGNMSTDGAAIRESIKRHRVANPLPANEQPRIEAGSRYRH